MQLPYVDLGAEGAYDVVVSDGAGLTNTSSAASLSLSGKPLIVQNLAGLVVVPGATATFRVTTTNTALLPITYEWLKDDLLLASHTVDSRADSLTMNNVQAADVGIYCVRITNRAIAAPGLSSWGAPLMLDSDGDGMPDGVGIESRAEPRKSSGRGGGRGSRRGI